MEGVLVKAKGTSSTVTVTVVTDARGNYSFPNGKLQPGDYRLAIRAAGYDLEDPGVVRVGTRQTQVDLTLKKTGDLSAQMMAAEWLLSIQGTPEHKTGLEVDLDMFDKDRCTMCHAFSLVTKSGHDAQGWVRVLDRMRFHVAGATPTHPNNEAFSPDNRQYWGRLPGGEEFWNNEEEGGVKVPPQVLKQAAYLASINLSTSPDSQTFRYPLRTLPRPTGDETKVVITEFDLPRPDSSPHDAVVDRDGMIWYQDFGQPFIGRLDPRTGEVKEWRVPAIRPSPPFAPGGLDVKIDSDGNPWFAIRQGAALMKFDKRTEQMSFYTPPPPLGLRSTVSQIALSSHAPTKWIWFKGQKYFGLDLHSNQVTRELDIPGGAYGIEQAADGTLFSFSMGGGVIGELNPTTGESGVYPTPTPDSGPRRGEVDAKDRVWFAEYYAGNIANFDRATKQIKEWPMLVPFADPYDVTVDDKRNEVWTGGMVTDYRPGL